MINDLLLWVNYENIYLIANWGVIPFWLLLIIVPNHSITKFATQSIVATLILASAYSFVAYDVYLEGNILDSFELYGGLDGLYSMFSNEALLLIFWLHFLAISLFIGSWIVRDSSKFMVSRIFVTLSLIFTYFAGPVGLLFYWFFRIFFAKRISFDD
jgi:hypothetical protein